MPKKLGINTKSVEAKLRKDAVKHANAVLTEKLKEDKLWKDDDKHIQRKMNRKEEKEKKKQELFDRKAGNKAILEEEMSSLKSTKNNEQKVAKITRNDINTFIEKQSNKPLDNKNKIEDQIPIEDNVNRLIDDEGTARNVDDAISLLSVNEPELDRHPERRMKAAFTAFESENLPRLKSENPNLRLSQLKQMLKKDWMKSPDNPLNQRHISYNSKN